MKINYRGIELEVTGNYTPACGDGFNEPADPDEYEASSITLEGVSICELLSGDQWSEIENICADQCKAGAV